MAQAILNSGSILERTVKSVLTGKGFELLTYREWMIDPSLFGKELLLTNAPYPTIYHHRGTTEFLLKSEKYNLEIRIECKWQQVAGSVDEKLPYLYLNCLETIPEKHILIVIDGDGWKKGSIDWLKDAIQTRKYRNEENEEKIIDVRNMREFMTWANVTFTNH